MAVELRTIDAHKLRLAVNLNAAAATHPRTIDHNGIQ